MPEPVVIIPTLNENDNIAILLKRIVNQYPDMHVLVIDGRSTDGTLQSVRKLQEQHHQIRLCIQPKGGDFGDAIALGFKTALDMDCDPILTMDGDLSHDPAHIKRFLDLQEEYDVILGSRYINGVRVEGWQFRKLFFSKLANMYISYIMIRPLWDFTSGFRLYSRRFVESLNLGQLEKQAYLLQVQLLFLAYKDKFSVKEIPIFFRDRYPGKSKILHDSMLKTLIKVLKYRAPLSNIIKHLNYFRRDYHHFVTEYEELVNPPKLKKIYQIENKSNFSISIGVMAYNEEHWIRRCLTSLINQKTKNANISEIIVVSSGSTDRTNQIVMEMVEEDSRITLVEQISRRGKASAINEFLHRASGDIAIVSSADLETGTDTVELLTEPFLDERVGVTGCHPIPVNSGEGVVAFFVNKMWALHHLMALDNPKCGEMIAFRNIIEKIPNFTAVDEAAIESIFYRLNYEMRYVPEATVNNKGPETMKDFMKQRKRIASGHMHLKATIGYRVSTYKSKSIFGYVWKSQKWNITDAFKMLLLICVEGYCRMSGKLSYNLKNKNPFIWDISLSTKK